MNTAFVRLASVSLIALILVCLAWEMWLAPLRPGGSMLALKVLPLLLPLRGILHGRRYTYQWTSLMILLYLAEGLVRSMSDQGLGQWLATAETHPGDRCFSPDASATRARQLLPATVKAAD
jgi:uncharacterized membrane protein